MGDLKKEFYVPERDGVTQSLLAMWLACREKARLYLEGWDSRYHSPALTFGSVIHGGLELAYLDIQAGRLKTAPSAQQSIKYIDLVERKWRAENLSPNKEALAYLEESLALAEKILPLYFDFWSADFTTKNWVSLEEKFSMSIAVTSRTGKVVTLDVKGKKDGTFKASKGLWLLETKTKSQVNENDLMDTLGFEQQVMIYLLETYYATLNKKDPAGSAPRGVLYNVIRKTAAKRKVGESVSDFAKKVAKDMEKRPDFYFLRIECPVSAVDLINFQKDFQRMLGEFYDWCKGLAPNYRTTGACMGKFGKCVYLPVCSRNEFSSLVKRKSVFKELEDV